MTRRLGVLGGKNSWRNQSCIGGEHAPVLRPAYASHGTLGALALKAIIGDDLLDPLRRRLQIDGREQHYAGYDDQRGEHQADSKKPGHRQKPCSSR
jgi:hypothetical protein